MSLVGRRKKLLLDLVVPPSSSSPLLLLLLLIASSVDCARGAGDANNNATSGASYQGDFTPSSMSKLSIDHRFKVGQIYQV